ncbi:MULTISPECIES: alpha/beta fold hydrolase [unclassified Halomonas]|uniref:alpha/beta fold hydrolase n=1 Tax=unclassified Halomonas TaxID=2609666 RepID=UPI0006D997AA|nr:MULTISPECIES: alpha/beta hydrolase [unclassified Halomonas]KPQ18705.1 MAG: putative hydrolases or acyltransferases (alpha/beta hydrolase superfamily) [Halomonas sp. HL-93]SBR47389.1 Pimeloyl-ACP methyl ester carboxylesterase [Halomonas sp. HL-93]SNY99187.1 Pimeloyl-ACP methyl ester carboxylesterase [Halomonas sp. hl-4]
MDRIEYISVRQLEIAVRIWHPDAPNTVIAWHGLARHGGDFASLARQLGPKWRVIAPDTPGRGLSSWSLYPANDYLYSHYMTIALALLDHFNIDRAAWIGTSMGGLLGMLLAANDATAKRIRCLVLNDVGPELDNQALTEMATYFSVIKRFSTLSELQQALEQHYQGFGELSRREWQQMALSSARRLPDGSWSFHYDPRIGEQFLHDTPRDTWSDWQRIRCPLMVIRGEHSTLLRAESVTQMQRDQPSLETLEAAGCGHAPMLNNAQQVAPLMRFLIRNGGVSESLTASPKQRLSQWWQRFVHQRD